MKKSQALIYVGPGVCAEYTQHIQGLFDKHIDVDLADDEDLIEKSWEEITQVVVIPGGEDIPYDRSLRGIGCQKIRDFVTRGGKYLGICAGAYFGGRKVEFAVGTEMEVSEDRELCFFEGVTKGPVLKNYAYHSEEGACAAKLSLPDGRYFFSYYNGGGTFVESSRENFTVLAKYENNLPAIIQCNVGEGVAILSGAHFEYNKKEYVKSTEEVRKAFIDYILNILLA